MPRQIKTAQDVQRVIGEIGVYLGKSLEGRIAGGDFGEFPDSGPVEFGRVSILGLGKQESLVNAARREAVDVLLLADVSQKAIGLGGAKRVTMRFRFIDVRKGETLWTSRPLSNSRKADKLTARELANIISEEIDDKYKLREMLPLTSEVASGRIAKLAASVPAWKSDKQNELLLSFLIEARYYNTMGWISDEEAHKAYADVVGTEKAELLAGDDAKQRRKALRDWLKEQ